MGRKWAEMGGNGGKWGGNGREMGGKWGQWRKHLLCPQGPTQLSGGRRGPCRLFLIVQRRGPLPHTQPTHGQHTLQIGRAAANGLSIGRRLELGPRGLLLHLRRLFLLLLLLPVGPLRRELSPVLLGRVRERVRPGGTRGLVAFRLPVLENAADHRCRGQPGWPRPFPLKGALPLPSRCTSHPLEGGHACVWWVRVGQPSSAQQVLLLPLGGPPPPAPAVPHVQSFS